MKVTVDGVDLFELTETQKDVICDNMSRDILDEDLKRRLQWVLMHKYEQCFAVLKSEWDKKLADNKVDMVPTSQEAYAKLVFSQPNYMCRKTRGAQADAARAQADAKNIKALQVS